MCFFYEQISLKKVFYKEARDSKRLLWVHYQHNNIQIFQEQ
jgi:hypothetical protein